MDRSALRSLLGDAVGVVGDELVAGGLRAVLEPALDRRIERVGDVRDHEREGHRPVEPKRTGTAMRDIAELIHGIEDALAGRLGQRDRAAVEDVGDERLRHAGATGDVRLRRVVAVSDPRGGSRAERIRRGAARSGGRTSTACALDAALLAHERDGAALGGEPTVGDVEHDAAVDPGAEPIAERRRGAGDGASSRRCRAPPRRGPRARTATGPASRGRSCRAGARPIASGREHGRRSRPAERGGSARRPRPSGRATPRSPASGGRFRGPASPDRAPGLATST